MPSTSNPKLKTLRCKSYQPIPESLGSNMDNAVAARNSNIVDDPLDQIGAGNLPTTYSSEQLMPASDSDSIEDGDRLADGVTQTTGFVPANVTHITHSLWFTVGVLCFVNLINYMDRFTIAGVLDDIQDDFKLGDVSGGPLQTVFVFSYMICAPIFGYLGDRYSRKWIISVGVLLWSTTTLLGSFMNNFGWFITFRALVGIGEASYSTIAPTIISDLFVHDLMTYLGNDWRWALRVTPVLGIAGVVLLSLINEPERGESEGSHNLLHTSYSEDIKHLVKNKSFLLSTAGFTCVAFVTGALAWWAPKFIYLGLKMQPDNKNLSQNDISFKFGAITMLAGVTGVPLGTILSQKLSKRFPTADPLICAFGLICSVLLLTGPMTLVTQNASSTYVLIFLGQLTLNMNWAIVADILLYVVVPTRRSTAEAFQILISHALGDAGSPFLVGVLSETIKNHQQQQLIICLIH